MTIATPTGLFDILPEDPKEIWRNIHLWHHLEAILRRHAESYSCHEIRTPIFERTELFTRSVGDETDIVAKEMYTFVDRGGRSMSLRPEGTASVMRSYIEKSLINSPIQRFFYIGPMFRYERPQSGRFRQHHQFGVEIIGNPHPEQDAEVIEMVYTLFQKLGLQNLQVTLNSLGGETARETFRKALIEYLLPNKSKLSEDSQRRLEKNPLRILDSKDPGDREIIEKGPSILDYLSEQEKAGFEKVQVILNHQKIPYVINDKLVRGIDYYNNTVFEVTSGFLGAQNALSGGGRYDGLLKQLKGPDLPSIGYAMGMERILQAMIKQKDPEVQKACPLLYIIPLGEKAELYGFSLASTLRQKNTPCFLDLSKKKLKNAMQKADKLNARYVLVVGDNEIEQNEAKLKEMQSGSEITISLDQVSEFLQKEITVCIEQ